MEEDTIGSGQNYPFCQMATYTTTLCTWCYPPLFIDLHMHYLRQLIRTVASSETKPVFFDPTLPDATLFQRLYKETLNGSYTSDDIAAKDIYKKNSSYGPYRSL